MQYRLTLPLAAALVLVACADDPSERSPTAPSAPFRNGANLEVSPETRQLEGLARRFALALNEPGFRERLHARLKASRFQENKLHFRRTVEADQRADLHAVARASGEPVEVVDSILRAAPPLEIYLPVPEHRAGWKGDDRLLVATAARDGDIPVAYDLSGGRHLLDPTHPPFTPVLALVPAETDFDARVTASATACSPDVDCDGGGSLILPPPAPAPGLYMTSARFNDDFEGWLKGSPEFEIHVMGQKGTTDSLTKLRCAGENQSSPYRWDGGTSWSGSVMLISQPDLNAFHTTHPGESVRIIALEDDDTACEMKVDRNLWIDLVGSIGPVYNDVTGAIDSGTVSRYIKAAKSV
ncbi:MAG: hypothetical protein OEV95_12815, partial [Gemmatimonadota bacterium]|nr:hypothetical protein [Gemmatimonadota bacterium]